MSSLIERAQSFYSAFCLMVARLQVVGVQIPAHLVLVRDEANKMFGHPAASIDLWKAECVKKGLIDRAAKDNSVRALLSKYKLQLIAANLIAANDTMAWIVAGEISL